MFIIELRSDNKICSTLQAQGIKDVTLTEEMSTAFEPEKHIAFIKKYSDDRSSYVSFSLSHATFFSISNSNIRRSIFAGISKVFETFH